MRAKENQRGMRKRKEKKQQQQEYRNETAKTVKGSKRGRHKAWPFKLRVKIRKERNRMRTNKMEKRHKSR